MFKKKKELLKERGAYGVQGGDYAGELLVFVAKDEDNVYGAISIPNMNVHRVSEEDIKKGLKAKILEFVEKIPKDVHEILIREYNHRITIKPIESEIEDEQSEEFDSGREQSTSQDLLDQPEAIERRERSHRSRDIHVPKDA